jgi:hypothetical protein
LAIAVNLSMDAQSTVIHSDSDAALGVELEPFGRRWFGVGDFRKGS